jgi:hypothetical protein
MTTLALTILDMNFSLKVLPWRHFKADSRITHTNVSPLTKACKKCKPV